MADGVVVGLFRKRLDIKEGDGASFWLWFKKHREEFVIDPKSGPSRETIGLLTQGLRSYNKKLVWEVGFGEDGFVELTISANGMIDQASSVRTLVASAPHVDGWRFFAFRQRDARGHGIQMGANHLDRDSVLFWANNEMPMHVAFYVPGYRTASKSIEGAVYVLLDGVIGEADAMEHITSVEFHDISGADSNTLPLRHMAELIDRRLGRDQSA